MLLNAVIHADATEGSVPRALPWSLVVQESLY